MLRTIERIKLLLTVVDLGQTKIGPVGHTLIQKLVYLLQAAKGVPLGYKFKLYYYGPYCKELWGELNNLEEYGFVAIASKVGGWGYDISLTPKGREWLANETDNTDEAAGKVSPNNDFRKEIEELLELLGGEPVRRLEALTTVHYIYSDWKRKGLGFSDDENQKKLIESVKNLKPHLEEDEIELAYKTLEEKALLP